jgi:branched-chain amino acid transport system substrate-binding protein
MYASMTLLLVIVLVLGLTACGKQDSASQGPPEYKIGWLLPLSAENAPQGLQDKRAADMAVEEINAAGGIKTMGGAKLKIVYADTQSKPLVAVSEAERLLTQEKVEFLSGAYHSGVTLPASEVAERYKRVWWASGAADDSITQRGFKNIFRMTESLTMRATGQIDFVKLMSQQSRVPIKTFALVYENSSFGQGMGKAWKILIAKNGWKVVLDEAFDAKMADPSPVITKVKTANPDVVMLANSAMPVTILMAKGFKEQNVKPKMFFASGGAQTDPDYLRNVGDAALGVFDISGWEPDLTRPFSAEVAKKFREKYGAPLNSEGAKEYAGVYVIKDVLERAGTREPEKVRDAFASSNITTGPPQLYAKVVHFDKDGGFPDTTSMVLVQFQKVNGKLERVTVGPSDQARSGAKPIFPYKY